MGGGLKSVWLVGSLRTQNMGNSFFALVNNPQNKISTEHNYSSIVELDKTSECEKTSGQRSGEYPLLVCKTKRPIKTKIKPGVFLGEKTFGMLM